MLCGEAKLSASARELPRLEAELVAKAERCPALAGKRIEPVLFVCRRGRGAAWDGVVTADDVVGA